ncbi:hypothetical protein [Thermoactinomyces sp. CICC 10521]|uniref:hypothetical protein n=1 Tax=Thermoactinomyces sp. CICC 10521 TaxID=2767426 RepID=UPI0018DCADE3|nr:hypothetical protein [Thermoactinomyces sp. CICC 10521]MBH8609104.1 hypothetical protein [Thermoactinomyces sp. CICC 10521]
MSLPEYMQIDLFSIPETPEEKPKKASVRKRKGTVYRCPKCGKTVGEGVPFIVAFCACGRRMEREDKQ